MIKNVAVSALTSLTVLALGVTYLSVNAVPDSGATVASEPQPEAEPLVPAYENAVVDVDTSQAVTYEELADLLANVGISFHRMTFHAAEDGMLRFHTRTHRTFAGGQRNRCSEHYDFPVTAGANDLFFEVRDPSPRNTSLGFSVSNRNGRGSSFSLGIGDPTIVSRRHLNRIPPKEPVRFYMFAHEETGSRMTFNTDEEWVDGYKDVVFMDIEYLPGVLEEPIGLVRASRTRKMS